MDAKGFLPGKRGGTSLRIDGDKLAVGNVFGRPRNDAHSLGRRCAKFHQVEKLRAQRRVSDVLASGRPDARSRVRTTRGYRGGRGRNGNAKHSCLGAACGDREGHAATQSGMTAMASTSTTHSGRASADTTRPVETGNTPLRWRPTTR